jgi:DMSO/TMAO reductase YedYZ molybdopterin-dependent catalytic subunit
MNPQRRFVLAALAAAGPMLAFAHPESAAPSSLVTDRLTVGGRVRQGLDLSLEALIAFPVQPLPEIPIRGRTGEILRTLVGYAGVRLTDLLDKAGLTAADHNDLKKTIVVAMASDDYKAVFSWNELFNTAVGAGVMVLCAREGKPLGDEEGRIALVSTQDVHTGPRHVRWLKDVQVEKIA